MKRHNAFVYKNIPLLYCREMAANERDRLRDRW